MWEIPSLNAQTYGPILMIRFGSKVSVMVSPTIAGEVLKNHDATFANRDVTAATRVATYGAKDIVWTLSSPEWHMLKVCMLKMLSNTTLDSVYALRRREIQQTIWYVYKWVRLLVNVGEQMFLTIANVITSMLWGGTVIGR